MPRARTIPNPYTIFPAQTFYTYDTGRTVANPQNFTLANTVTMDELPGRERVQVGNLKAKMMLADGREVSIIDNPNGFYSDAQMRLLRYSGNRKDNEVVIDAYAVPEVGEDI